MLWNATTINGFTVHATDGKLGTVTDLLFDDRDWTIRCLAVDAGGRAMVLPVTVTNTPDAANSGLPLKVTQSEAMGAAVAGAAGDPHLWSLIDLAGYTIQATDGAIGHAEDILLRGDDWQIRFLTTSTPEKAVDAKVMISRHAITAIDRQNRLIHLDVDRKAVAASPAYDETISVDGADDEKFFSYFGIKWFRHVGGIDRT